MAVWEEIVLEELRNIALNAPLFAGDTISHATANECVRRGWAERNAAGNFVLTSAGTKALIRVWVEAAQKTFDDPEIQVMWIAAAALEWLDPAARARALRWLTSFYCGREKKEPYHDEPCRECGSPDPENVHAGSCSYGRPARY